MIQFLVISLEFQLDRESNSLRFDIRGLRTETEIKVYPNTPFHYIGTLVTQENLLKDKGHINLCVPY